MVDSISQSGGAGGIKRTMDDASARVQKAKVGAPATGPAAPAGDDVQLTAMGGVLPQELKSGPPIEMALVTKIQDAIANGSYPIDLDKITESLFESYLELNS